MISTYSPSRTARRIAIISLGGALSLLAAGCADDLPTTTDPRFGVPGDGIRTIETELATEEFFELQARYGGFVTTPRFGTGLVASSFDGVLDARTLHRTGALPDTLQYTLPGAGEDEGETVTDSVFEPISARLSASVNVGASTADAPVRLVLRTVDEEWDPGSATWTLAVDTADDRREWTSPGGTLGAELADTVWESVGERFTDRLEWTLDEDALARLFDEEGTEGVAVVAEGAAARLELTSFALEVDFRPASHPVETQTRSVALSGRRAIFTPAEEANPPEEQAEDDPFSIGGLHGHRVYFTLALPDSLPACTVEEGGADACGHVPLEAVEINRARLIVDPVTVHDGFRLVGATHVRLREVTELHLGRQAPLGQVILDPGQPGRPLPGVESAADNLPVRRVETRDDRIAIEITGWVRSQASTAPDDVHSLAWLAMPEGGDFGIARFAPEPRFHLIYTILPELPAP